MKKYAILCSVGRWEYKDGKKVINCTVDETKLVADGDNYSDMSRIVAGKPVVYANDGHWYSYRVEERARAKRSLAK